MAPTQAVVLPIAEENNDYVKKLFEDLFKEGIQCEVDLRNQKINYKIREHSVGKIPILMICGSKEVQNKTITLRRLGQEDQQTESLEKVISSLSKESQAPKI